MQKQELFTYVREQYGIEPDSPWDKHPSNHVLRHQGSGRWFALVMDVPRNKIGREGEERISILNLKCDPIARIALKDDPNILPAYHMNKEHWITVVLDSDIAPEDVLKLIDSSFDMTR